MIFDPYPLSISERRARAQELRKEAQAKIEDAERIEEGIKADEAEMTAAIEKAVLRLKGGGE